ncbi:MAG: carboxypeptidase-like regulatory domain-containing protein [Planctomycetaceae bacterium]|nr:carboxypeptidase-like regulatory domain-containing protein [Planctomycetaceae bacterium]
MQRKHSVFVPVCCVLLMLNGCGGAKKPEGMPPLYPCQITITQEGKPLADAVVSLASENNKWQSSAQTDTKGVAELITYGQFLGVPAGTYKVLVVKRELDGPPPVSNTDAEGRVLGGPQGQPSFPKYIERVHPVYSAKESSPLTIEIKPMKSGNDQTFEVGKSP